jgi:hypothetical protein
LTGDLGVYLQRRAFLHVANKPFETGLDSEGDDEVHITNCCANSDNLDAFAGEIVIDDLGDRSPYPDIEGYDDAAVTEGVGAVPAGASGAGAGREAEAKGGAAGVQEGGAGAAAEGKGSGAAAAAAAGTTGAAAEEPVHPHPASFVRAFEDMQRILASLVGGAAPFLEAQRSPHDLEYMGLDFMVM